MTTPDTQASEALLQLLRAKLGARVIDSSVNLGDAVMRVDRGAIKEVLGALKSDPDFDFDLFVSVTAVDWMDRAPERFELVYHLLSLSKRHRLRIKAWVPEGAAEVESVSDLWPGANFMEREVWDMYGVRFKGHPDLRRILLYDEFKGHPLRKDYPVQAKQPRIPLRTPEVRNTAVDMQRPALVQINRRRENDSAQPRS